VVAETTTPDATRVVLFTDTWHEHILDPREGHGELAAHLDAVLATVSTPDHREPGTRLRGVSASTSEVSARVAG
jgi:hypothetical protein